MKGREEKDIFEKSWLYIIVTIYVLLILSLGFLGYHIFTAPVSESPPSEDVVIVNVYHYGDEPINMTVKLIDDSRMPIWKQFNATHNITSFGEKRVLPDQIATFKSSGHTYDNYPMDLQVYGTDNGEELLAQKSVRLTAGQSSGNEREFSIDVKP